MKRYRVSFSRWEEFEEYVVADSEGEAVELAQVQLDAKEAPEALDSDTNVTGVDEIED